MPIGKPITEDVERKVVDYYKSKPMTISHCAKHNGLSDPTVIKILDKHSVQRYKKAKIYNPSLREDYFRTIDSEEKAYFLGLIISDGNVFNTLDGNRQTSISITQSEKDEYILELFLNELCCSTKVAHDGRGTSTAAVRSDIIANDLSQYGIVPNKTLFAYLPQNIDDEYMPHLIRGIMDGDGNITSTITGRGRHKHAISFCGTHKLMDDLAEYISNTLHILKPKVYDYADRHLSEVKWQSVNDVKILGEWLYNNATIYLQRKRDTFDDFVGYYFSDFQIA